MLFWRFVKNTLTVWFCLVAWIWCCLQIWWHGSIILQTKMLRLHSYVLLCTQKIFTIILEYILQKKKKFLFFFPYPRNMLLILPHLCLLSSTPFVFHLFLRATKSQKILSSGQNLLLRLWRTSIWSQVALCCIIDERDVKFAFSSYIGSSGRQVIREKWWSFLVMSKNQHWWCILWEGQTFDREEAWEGSYKWLM